jgi:hypothetical protein
MSRALSGTGRCFLRIASKQLIERKCALPAASRSLARGATCTSWRTVVCQAGASTTEPEAPPSPQLDGDSGAPHKSTAYPFTDIERKWQAYWEDNGTFRTPDFADLDTSKPKFYALDMFPYPRRATWRRRLCCVASGPAAAADGDGRRRQAAAVAWQPPSWRQTPSVAHTPSPASPLPAAAQVCMWATRKGTLRPTSSRVTSA